VQILDALATEHALPFDALLASLVQTLNDARAGRVHVPDRMALPVASGSTWLVMPAWLDNEIAIAKLITVIPDNPAQQRPAISGDVLVIRAATGVRLALLDGPTVTARRTAAVSALAGQRLAAVAHGPVLIVGAGVQGRAHAQAFIELLGVREIWLQSRTRASAEALAEWVADRWPAVVTRVVDDANQAMVHCPVIVTTTTANAICLSGQPRADAFIAAVGAFKPAMLELAPHVVQWFRREGRIVADTVAAEHEAGDLLQAGIEWSRVKLLGDLVAQENIPRGGPVLFKSCGSALWDLAAARVAVQGFS
jgi:1-piperideine-2-carboxylate/1-pyrroline-2-carboxylate reductase [NAD(P)H]